MWKTCGKLVEYVKILGLHLIFNVVLELTQPEKTPPISPSPAALSAPDPRPVYPRFTRKIMHSTNRLLKILNMRPIVACYLRKIDYNGTCKQD